MSENIPKWIIEKYKNQGYTKAEINYMLENKDKEL